MLTGMASGGVSGDQYIDFKAAAYVLYNGVLFIPKAVCACSLKHYHPSQRPDPVPGSALCFFKRHWLGVCTAGGNSQTGCATDRGPSLPHLLTKLKIKGSSYNIQNHWSVPINQLCFVKTCHYAHSLHTSYFNGNHGYDLTH